MAISYRGASNAAGQALGSAGASTVSITPTLPSGAVSDDRIFVVQCGTTTSGSTPANWNVVGTKDRTVGSGAVASGSGARRITVYYRDYDGVWSMPAFTLASTTNNSHWVGAVAITPTAGGYTWNTPTTTGVGASFNAVTTSYTDTSAASFTTHSGGFLIVGSCFNDNVTSSASAVSQSGATFGAVSERCDGGTGTGNIVSGKVHTCSVTTGAAATITQTQTISANSQGETVFIEQTETPPLSKVDTLTDSFATEDGAKWTGYASADVGVVAGQLHCDGGSDQLISVASYNLTASSAYVEVPVAGAGFSFQVQDAGFSRGGGFTYDGISTLYLISADGTTLFDSSITYNATTHRWLRLRESGGTIFWEASTTGSSWSTLNSVAYPSTGVLVQFTGDGTVFDNFNTTPAPSNTGAFFAMI